jgi:hypothetical protein
LQNENRIPIFISKVVLNESQNNFQKQIEDVNNAIRKELLTLNKLALTSNVNVLIEPSNFLKEYNSFYDTKINSRQFEIVNYSENILPQLVQRSIKRIKPFTEARQEFRDAIIWLSYVDYIKQNSLENCFLITNNKRDFWDDSSKNLHPDLQKEVKDLKVYSNFQELLSKETSLLAILKEREFENWLNKRNLLAPDITQIIKDKLWTQIKDRIGQGIDRLNPQIYFKNVRASYFEYTYDKEALRLGRFTINQISNFGYVECNILIDGLAIIYPIDHWKKEKRPITFNITLSFTFDIDLIVTDYNVSNVNINSVD